MDERVDGICASTTESRCMDWRAAVNDAIGDRDSIGAKARPIMIDAAIMAPAVNSCWI